MPDETELMFVGFLMFYHTAFVMIDRVVSISVMIPHRLKMSDNELYLDILK